MNRFSVMACVIWLSGLLLLPGGEAQAAEAVKPPWQRLLQGEKAKEAAEQEKQLAQLQEAGQFAEALKVAEVLAELRRRRQGADHWQAINARFAVEALRRVLRATKDEQQRYRRLEALQRQAEALTAKGDHRQAQPLFEEVLSIQRKLLGEDYPQTATSYGDLAMNLNAQGKYIEAEEIYGKALAIRRKVLGEEHPQTAISYNNLAYNLSYLGKYTEAQEKYSKALVIWRKVLGEEHPDTITNYNNLAHSLNAQGKYKEAEESYRKALALFRKVLGEEHPLTANCYDNLAANQSDQGKYQQAEEGCRKALSIRRKVLGEEHPDTAQSYSNLSYNQNAQGKYKEAEESIRKALTIFRKVLGEEHPYTATGYTNVGYTLSVQGKHREAEEDLRRGLSLRRKALGEEHPDTAQSYDNLASNQNTLGKYREAEIGHRKALAIYRRVLGEEHPQTANCYNNLAANLNAQGKHPEAEEVNRKTLAIRRKVLGEQHPDTADGYQNLALNLNAQGKYREAEIFFRHAADSFNDARLHAAVGLQRAAFTSKHSPLPALAAVLARNGKPAEAWQRFEESLSRGAWDDLSARLRRPQAERAKQDQLVTQLNRLEQLLAQLYSVKTPSPEQIKQRQSLLTQQRQTLEELAFFTRHLEEKYGPAQGKVFSRVAIQASLPSDAALVGWLDLPGEPQAADPNGEHWAVLLRSADSPVWVRLSGSGERHTWTDADSSLPAQLRSALQAPRSLWQPLAQRLRQQRLEPLTPHLKEVRRLIVLPSTALAGLPVEVIAEGYTVSYAHSGTMYAHVRQQPPASDKGLFALADPVFETPTVADNPQPVPPGGVLLTVVLPDSNAHQAGLKANDVLLRYGDTELTVPADLKTKPESSDPKQSVPVVVWRNGQTLTRPLYLRTGKLGAVLAKGPAPQAVAEQRRWDRWLASRSSDGLKWDRLPGTRYEVTSLRRLFAKDEPAEVLMDSAAGEAQLSARAKSRVLGRYRYLHLATHGQVDDVFPLRSALILSQDRLPDERQRQELLLAGQPIPDGRLTAQEVLEQWQLHCDLVTLSACQTALGKYERGEGFVGFAQALILAGSRSVCLSLWKVNDTATALLMERFYQNLLGKREGLDKPLSKAEALAEAKDWLRKLPRAEALKHAASLSEGQDRGPRRKLPPLEVPAMIAPANADYPYAHPYYWAAFVLMGDPY